MLTGSKNDYVYCTNRRCTWWGAMSEVGSSPAGARVPWLEVSSPTVSPDTWQDCDVHIITNPGYRSFVGSLRGLKITLG